MVTLSAKLKLYITTSKSLKNKRAIRQSVIAKVKQKFNVAISEVDAHDLHQALVLGVAVVSADRKHAQEMIDTIIEFIEDNAEAELIDVEYKE